MEKKPYITSEQLLKEAQHIFPLPTPIKDLQLCKADHDSVEAFLGQI